MHYLYYPGCSLKATGKPYEESLLAVFRALGIDVDELKDWNCCGATTYMGVDEVQAFALAARNLALAERQASGAAVVAPCNACYLVLNKAQHYVSEYPDIRKRVTRALKVIELEYCGDVNVRHPLDILVNDYGIERIGQEVKQPLAGLNVACYCGCQIVRPYSTFDDQHNPQSMERLLRAAGANVIDWPLKTRCCGAALTGTIPTAGTGLSDLLLKEARRRGANTIATCCPLCQHNLECYQAEGRGESGTLVQTPVVYFTQLLGLALGLKPKSLGLKRMLIALQPPAQATRAVL